MSDKNFMSYDDAAEVLGEYANSIKAATPTEITYQQWLQLTPEQQASGNYIVSDYPGADGDLDLLQPKTLTTPLNISGSSKTTVEDALCGLNTELLKRSGRTRANITSNLSNLVIAVSEQNLEKYGYAVGDYFTGASGYTYILGSLNIMKGTHEYNVTTNHIGIVVDTHATSKWLDGGDATSVGYVGSDLHAYLTGTVLNNIKSDFIALFGGTTGLEHLAKHYKLYTTGLANWGWSSDQYISALTESQVYGHTEWSGNIYQEGEAVNQLDVFKKFKWTEIFGNEYPWLRNLYTATYACLASDNGYAGIGSVAGAAYVVGLINFY